MLTSLSARAQDFDDREARAGLTIGPGIQTGASMTLDSKQGYKIKPVFAYKLEAHATYPLTPIINAGLGLGYESRGTREHVFDRSDIWQDYRVGYFTINPSFSFSGVNMGFVFGFPVGGGITNYGGASFDFDESDDIPVMIDARLEGVIPIYDDEVGWLSLVFGGGYSLNELIDYPEGTELFGDWNHVSGHIGFRFEFLVPDTER